MSAGPFIVGPWTIRRWDAVGGHEWTFIHADEEATPFNACTRSGTAGSLAHALREIADLMDEEKAR